MHCGQFMFCKIIACNQFIANIEDKIYFGIALLYKMFTKNKPAHNSIFIVTWVIMENAHFHKSDTQSLTCNRHNHKLDIYP